MAAASTAKSRALHDTIYALAGGRPPSAISVLRVSGPRAADVHAAICRTRRGSAALPAPRVASLRQVHHPLNGELLDEAMALWFPESRSYTGEPTLELHVHGSPAVVRDVLDAIAAMQGSSTSLIRPAREGEFTRRAYHAGKLDLNSCEALDALLRAETSAQRRLALGAGGGRQAAAYERIRAQLLACMAHVEALLDFGEEDSVDESVWPLVLAQVDELRTLLRAEVSSRTYADIVTDGLRVVLYGQPNAGKSSLLNRLARRDAAIVSAKPGTTRDVVSVSLEIDGHRVILSDTAGLRGETADEIELAGMARTENELAVADIPILVCTPEEAAEFGTNLRGEYVYINKMDTVELFDDPAIPATVWKGDTVTDSGTDALLAGLAEVIKAYVVADKSCRAARDFAVGHADAPPASACASTGMS